MPGPHKSAGTTGLLESARSVEDLYRMEAPRLLRSLRKRLRPSEDPLDVVQEAFACFIGADALRRRNPQAFLQRIVRNLLIDRSRRPAFRAEHVPIHEDLDIAVPPEQAYALEADALMRKYRSAVSALPPRTRQVFLLHRVNELSYKAIAEQLGISVRTVEWHFAQGIAKIGKALEIS